MVASEAGPKFPKAFYASHATKDADYVVKLFLEVVEEICDSNVVQIITDNALNYKVTSELIESKYPRIFGLHFKLHCLNLAIKYICEPRTSSAHYSHYAWK